MKICQRMLSLIFVLTMCLMLAGCGKQEAPSVPTEVPLNAAAIETPIPTTGPKVDLDITELSAVMISSVVNNILDNPLEYEGQRVRLAGYYSSLRDYKTGEKKHFLSVSDPMACCFADGSVTMELRMPEDVQEHYPQEDQKFEIVGVVTVRMEGKRAVCVMNVETIELLDEWLSELIAAWYENQ